MRSLIGEDQNHTTPSTRMEVGKYSVGTSKNTDTESTAGNDVDEQSPGKKSKEKQVDKTPRPNKDKANLSFAESFLAQLADRSAAHISRPADQMSSPSIGLYIGLEIAKNLLVQVDELAPPPIVETSSTGIYYPSVSEQTNARRSPRLLSKGREQDQHLLANTAATTSSNLGPVLAKVLATAEKRGVARALQNCLEQHIVTLCAYCREVTSDMSGTTAGATGAQHSTHSSCATTSGTGTVAPAATVSSGTSRAPSHARSSKMHNTSTIPATTSTSTTRTPAKEHQLQRPSQGCDTTMRVRRYWSALKVPLDEIADSIAHRELASFDMIAIFADTYLRKNEVCESEQQKTTAAGSNTSQGAAYLTASATIASTASSQRLDKKTNLFSASVPKSNTKLSDLAVTILHWLTTFSPETDSAITGFERATPASTSVRGKAVPLTASSLGHATSAKAGALLPSHAENDTQRRGSSRAPMTRQKQLLDGLLKAKLFRPHYKDLATHLFSLATLTDSGTADIGSNTTDSSQHGLQTAAAVDALTLLVFLWTGIKAQRLDRKIGWRTRLAKSFLKNVVFRSLVYGLADLDKAEFGHTAKAAAVACRAGTDAIGNFEDLMHTTTGQSGGSGLLRTFPLFRDDIDALAPVGSPGLATLLGEKFAQSLVQSFTWKNNVDNQSLT
ncbi:unnamed protein product [Amoebophrya sp. A25]|nr:unnamed protein product [Amoebophrya sp. A25]|eukprot:GSA25T00010168001.1